MSNNQGGQPAFQRTYLDHNKLKLRGNPWGDKKRPSLHWSFWDNMPSLNLFMNTGDFNKYVRLGMSMQIANEMLILMEETIEGKRDGGIIELRNKKDHRGNTPPEGKFDMVVARITFNRNQKGIFQLAVCPVGEQNCVFAFGHEWRNLLTLSGEAMDQGEVSKLAALSYTRMFQTFINTHVVVHSQEPIQRGQGGGGGNYNKGGNNNWNKGGNSGGGSSGWKTSSSDVYDADIPY